jgi:adenylate kinase
MNQKSFIFIGRSGCGKGTQAKLLLEYLKQQDPGRETLYVQTGAIFREFIQGESDTQKKSKIIYDNGEFQPEFLAIYMWSGVFINKYKNNEHVVMDGMPRKLHEAGILDSLLNFYNLKNTYVINIDVPKEVSMDRLLARKRFDDTREEIAARLADYEVDVVPILEYYKANKDYNFVHIDGTQSIEDIHKEILSKI